MLNRYIKTKFKDRFERERPPAYAALNNKMNFLHVKKCFRNDFMSGSSHYHFFRNAELRIKYSDTIAW